MYRAQRFRLYPTSEQEVYFRQAAGAARHAYNWGLALRQRYYRRFQTGIPLARLKRQWNKHKKGKKSWAAGVGKEVTSNALTQMDKAYRNFFAGRSRFPRFKSKRCRSAKFAVADEGRNISFRGKSVRLPIVGLVRFANGLRWPNAKKMFATIRENGGRWFLIVRFELPDPKPETHNGPSCGIDLGSTVFATIASNGLVVDEIKPPKPYVKNKRKLKRLQRMVNRRKDGGKNLMKAKKAVAVLHWRITNVRSDFLHKLSRQVAKTYGRLGMEDLNVKGMQRGLMSKVVGDLGFGEFRRQVTYKAEATGTKVVIADRFYPSSKTCSHCGLVKTKLELSERTWTCECGVTHNRDHNAAINLEKLGRGAPKVTPAEIGGSPPSRKTKRGAGRGSRNAKTTSNGS
jgi:putative transposase